MIRTASDVSRLGTILGIWAHPDDEAYLSGGLMALARTLGSRVVCVTATHGELGTADPLTWPPVRLATERTAELSRCLGILGVTEHHWLDHRDGQCAAAPTNQAVDALSRIIGQVDPDTVLTFGADGITGHPDHRAVGSWAEAAFDRAARPSARLLQAAVPERQEQRWGAMSQELGVYLPGYPITVPHDRLAIDLILDPDTSARKVEALAAQTTQTSGLIAALGRETYAAWVGDESFVERLVERPG